MSLIRRHCVRNIKQETPQNVLRNLNSFSIRDFEVRRSFVHAHQVMMMDNCFLKAKYKYQFMSTLDIDEFILPRFYPIGHYKKIFNQSKDFNTQCSQLNEAYTNKSNKYSLYGYMMKMKNVYGNNTASFVFTNHALIPEITDRLEVMFNNSNQSSFLPQDMNLRKGIDSPEDKQYLK